MIGPSDDDDHELAGFDHDAAVRDDDHRTRRRRRNAAMRPRHVIDAWGATSASSGAGATTTTTTTARATSSLSEGENWIVVPPPPPRGAGRSDDDDDDDPPLSGPRAFVSRDRRGWDEDGIVVLCVDVDDVGRVATVKDVRHSTSSSSCYSDDGVADDDDEEVADGSEFFLARRRSRRRRLRGPPWEPIPCDATPAASGSYDENATGDLDADDDDSDFDDKIERRNDVSAERRPPPPREDDVNDDGEFLYHPPELLPRRQMRVLRDGDRILMRCRSPPRGDRGGSIDNVRWVKLEYRWNVRPDEMENMQVNVDGTHDAEKDRCSGKSAIMDRSEVASSGGENEMRLGIVDENPAGEEKGLIKDRDYTATAGDDTAVISVTALGEASHDCITATTGDDTAVISANALGEANDGECKSEYDGSGFSTTRAVFLGAPSSSQGPADDREMDDIDRPEVVHSPTEACSDGDGVSIKSSHGDCEPNEEEEDDANVAIGAILETSKERDDFLTGRTSENDSEEELLSQPDIGDFPLRFQSQGRRSDGSDSDGSETDISKTQPYPLPRSALNNSSRQSISSFGDDDDDDSTECTEQNREALSPLPKTAEIGDSDKDDHDSRSENEAAQEPNGTVDASYPASFVNSTELPETSDKGGDESVSGDPFDNEATQNFLLAKSPKFYEIYRNDEDDEAYEAETQAETQSENDVYQAETQTLPFLSINLPAKSSLKDNENSAITYADTVDNQSKLPAKSESPINDTIDTTCPTISPSKTSRGVHFELPLCDFGGILENDENKDAGGNVQGTTKRPAEKLSEQVQVQLSEATDSDSSIEKQHLEISLVNSVGKLSSVMLNQQGGFNEGGSISCLKQEDPDICSHSEKNMPSEGCINEALQSDNSNPSPLVEASASPDATVCQTDNTEVAVEQIIGLAKEACDQIVAHSVALQQETIGDNNAGGDVTDRDPNFHQTITHCGTHSTNDHDLTPTSDRFTRRRAISSSGRRKESRDAVKIMFTGFVPTRHHKQMINDIGARLVESIEEASTATHVIASDGKTSLRRTPKLMICVCKTSKILSIRWLERSAKEQRVLNTDDFLILDDREAEETYKFSMKETLENGRKARLERGGVLGEWYVYICPGVAGNNAPSSKELAFVIKATGATLLSSLSESEIYDPTKTLVITSDPSTTAQRSDKGVRRATRLGAKLFSTRSLFHVIITQKFVTEAENTTPRKKRKAVESLPNHGGKRISSRKR